MVGSINLNDRQIVSIDAEGEERVARNGDQAETITESRIERQHEPRVVETSSRTASQAER